MGSSDQRRLTMRACLFFTLGACLLPAISAAQQYYDPGLLQKTVDRRPSEYQSPGIRAGSFELNTGAELAWENNDNIFYSENFGISDNILHVRPWLNANSDWNRHELNFSAFADFASYSDFSGQNYSDWTMNLDGRIDVRRGSAFDYRASYLNLHEDLRTPESQQSIEPTEYSIGGVGVGYTHQFNRLAATVSYQSNDYSYKNGKNINGEVVDNSDRDRTQDTWAVRLGYDYSDQSAIFVEYAGNNVDYDLLFDRSGADRSSSGYDVRGGITWNMTGVLTGDLYLQYLEQQYDDPMLKDVNGFGLGASLEWTPTQLTSVGISFSNTVQDTTLIGASGYFSSLYSARIQHELRRNILLNARFSYTDNQYEYGTFVTPYDDPEGIPIEDNPLKGTQITRAGVGISYLIGRHFYLSGGYVYEKQDANEGGFRYTTNRFYITLGGEL